jgi:hypothetical protein
MGNTFVQSGQTLSASENVQETVASADTIGHDLLTFPQSLVLSSQEILSQMGILFPRVMEATVIILIGWGIGVFIEWIFIKLGERLKLTRFWEKTGFNSLLRKANIQSTPSKLTGTFIKSVIILFFLRQSVIILGFSEVEEFIGQIIILVPDIVIALVILLFTIRVAGTAASLIENFLGIGDRKSRKIIAIIIKNILIAFGTMAVLVQLHIAEKLVQILFTALVSMLALAGGLAFGLGGKDFVREMICDFKNKKEDNHSSKNA